MADPVKDRLKIAILVRRFITTGGMEKYVVETTRRLASSHDVHVFAQEGSWEGDEKITLHRVPKYFTKPSFLNLLVFSYFTRKMVDDSFDIVHSHERVTKFNTLTVHCPCFRTYITEEPTPWKRALMWLAVALSPRKMAYIWLESRQFSYQKDRMLVAVSEIVKKNVRQNYSLSDDYFALACPGVDDGLIKQSNRHGAREEIRSGLGIGRDDLVVLFVGNEFKRKGLDSLLKGFSLIRKPGVKLVVVGGDDTGPYVRLSRSLGIEQDVVFLGTIGNMGDIYLISDIYVLPTLSEPAGMAPLEAMAAGVPTILSSARYAGSSERIENGEALLLEDPRNPEEISGALTKMMNRDFRAEMSRKGQELARTFTWEKTTEQTLDVYKRIMEKRRRALLTKIDAQSV